MRNSSNRPLFGGSIFNQELKNTKQERETVVSNRAMRRIAKKNPGITHNVYIQVEKKL